MGNEFISVAGGATNLAMDFKVSLLPAGRLFSVSFRPPYAVAGRPLVLCLFRPPYNFSYLFHPPYNYLICNYAPGSFSALLTSCILLKVYGYNEGQYTVNYEFMR
jgi:hypothetical protein